MEINMDSDKSSRNADLVRGPAERKAETGKRLAFTSHLPERQHASQRESLLSR